MPNTPITVGKGFAAASGGKYANELDIQWLQTVLSPSCRLITIAEDEQDAITALSGSGPAYFFAMVEAMAEAGRKLGLNKEDSLSAAKEVLIGAAAMIEKSGKDPKTLRENVTSPNGTTFAALKTFQEADFQEIVFKAMKAARDRSIELSR
jgi:pyrroline-5-carboxylate reductase